jgi:hypothetical protein
MSYALYGWVGCSSNMFFESALIDWQILAVLRILSKEKYKISAFGGGVIEFNIEQDSVQQTGEGGYPTHKIVLKYGSETSVFWYIQEPKSCNPTEPPFDKNIFRQIFLHAQALLVGEFLYLSMDNGQNYHLQRTSGNRYSLKALA